MPPTTIKRKQAWTFNLPHADTIFHYAIGHVERKEKKKRQEMFTNMDTRDSASLRKRERMI